MVAGEFQKLRFGVANCTVPLHSGIDRQRAVGGLFFLHHLGQFPNPWSISPTFIPIPTPYWLHRCGGLPFLGAPARLCWRAGTAQRIRQLY